MHRRELQPVECARANALTFLVVLGAALAPAHASDSIDSGEGLNAFSTPSPYPSLADLPSEGLDVPKSLLRELAAKAVTSEETLQRFTCVEDLESHGKRDGSHDYLLRSHDGTIEELRFRKDGRPVHRRATAPPAAAWLLLFSEVNQRRFIYRDLGTGLDGFDQVHRIFFQGDVPPSDGQDVREWEGIAALDPDHNLLYVQATPRLHAERLALQGDKHRRSLRVTLGVFASDMLFPIKTFRLRRSAHVPLLVVHFNQSRPDVRLPLTMTLQQLGAPPTTARMQVVESRSYRDYRLFATRTLERYSEVPPDRGKSPTDLGR